MASLEPYDEETLSYVPLYTLLVELDNWNLPDWVSAGFERRKHLISAQGFPRYTAASESKLKTLAGSNTFDLPGPAPKTHKSSHKITTEELKLATEAASKFDLDAEEALVLLRSYKVWLKGPNAWTDPEAELDVDDLDGLQVFYFDERLATIHLLRAASTSGDDAEGPQELRELYDSLSSDLIPADFSQQVLDAFQHLTLRALPDTTSAQKAADFAKQFLREQREWLDLLFLWWYRRPATGADCVRLLDTLHQTEWAAKQAHAGFWDAEAAHLAKVVRHTLGLVALVAFNLESYASDAVALPHQSLPLPDKADLLHPDNLKAVHAQIVALAQAFIEYSAPLVLGWSHILCSITESLESSQEPVWPEYRPFIEELTQGDQPLWQKLLSHALPRLFLCLSNTLTTVTTAGPDALGALTVLKTPLALLPTMVELGFLPEPHLRSMNDFAAKLFGHSDAQVLRQQFWSNKLNAAAAADESMTTPDLLTTGQERLFDFQARRFPLQPVPFLQLLRALSGSEGSAEAEWATLSLRQLPCITCYVPTSPIMRPYDVDPTDPQRIIVAHPAGLRVSKSVTVPVGAGGWLLSDISGPQAIARFDLPEDGWDAWAWVQDLLETYAAAYLVSNAPKTRQNPDPFSADGAAAPSITLECDAEADEAASDALNLLAKDMLGNGSGPLKSPKAAQKCANMLFAVLEKSLFTKAQSVTAATLRALKALLPAYPGMVWSLIRAGKGDLFTPGLSARSARGGSALLAADRNSGTYSALFALIELVEALVQETRSTIAPPDYLQVKAEVLSGAFTWLLDEVLTAGFGSWRFQDGKARWQLASALLGLFAEVASDALLGRRGHLGGAAETLLAPLLVDCTSGAGDCVMPVIGILSAAYDGIVTGIKTAVDAEVCRQALRSALDFILQLLFLRSSRSQTPSLLEQALISAPVQSSRLGRISARAPVSTLFACCLNATALQPSISELAAQVLATTAQLSVDFKRSSNGSQTLAPIFTKPEEQSKALMEVANDRHLPTSFRVAVWQLMTALLETQPALTMLFALGRFGPPVNAPDQVSESRDNQTALSKPTDNNVRRAVDIFKGGDILPPEILQALLSFLEMTWERVQNFPSVMQPLRDDTSLWQKLVDLAVSPVPPAVAPSEDPDTSWIDEAATGQCHRIMARATAARLVAADLTGRLDAAPGKGSSSKCLAFTILESTLKSNADLTSTLVTALANDADVQLHADLQVLFKTRFPAFEFASVHRSAPISSSLSLTSIQRRLGTGYLYDPELAARRIRSSAKVDYDEAAMLEQLLRVNLNWSFIDSQLAVTRAWSALLGAVYPYARTLAGEQSNELAKTALTAAIEAIDKVSEEDQCGDIVAAIHAERLTLLTRLLEGALFSSNNSSDQLARLVKATSGLLFSDALNPFDSLRAHPTAGFHRPLLSLLFLVIQIMRQPSLARSSLQLPMVADVSRTLEATLRLSILGLRLLLTAFSTSSVNVTAQGESTIHDVKTLSALFQAVIRLPHAPAPTVWLAYCMESDLFRIQLALISNMAGSSPGNTKGLTLVQPVLDLLLAISAFGPGAERLATEGLLMVITTSPLAPLAEEGIIRVQDTARSGERDPMHAIWCTTTAIVARLASFLESSPAFIAEVCGYVQLFRPQLAKPLAWLPSSSLTLAAVEEMQATVALIALLARRSAESEAFQSLLEDVWIFLNTLVYVIQHPNTLVSALEPLSQAERVWLDKASSEPVQNDSVGFSQRPSTGALIQTFMSMVSVLTESCCIAVRAFDVLNHEKSVWPYEKAVVYPTAKVGLHEPATIGTLIDLATWCLDLLRHHASPVSAVAADKITSDPAPSSFILPCLDNTQLRSLATRSMEAAFLLSATQMAMVYSKAGEMTKSKDMVRMRRDIASELVPDLVSLINKASNLEAAELKKTSSLSSSTSAAAKRSQLLFVIQRFVALQLASR